MVRLAFAAAVGALLAGCFGVATVGRQPVYVEPSTVIAHRPCPAQAGGGSRETTARTCEDTQPKCERFGCFEIDLLRIVLSCVAREAAVVTL